MNLRRSALNMTDPLIEIYDEPILARIRSQGQWTRKKETMSKLAQAAEMNTKAVEENGKAEADMVNLLRAKVIQ